MRTETADTRNYLALDIEDLPSRTKKTYYPLQKRGAILAGLQVTAGCATSFVLPRVEKSLSPLFLTLLTVLFADTFSKSGKKFLKSIDSLKGKATAVAGLLSFAAAWDCATKEDLSQIENWGLTFLTLVAISKAGIDKLASYQKPIK